MAHIEEIKKAVKMARKLQRTNDRFDQRLLLTELNALLDGAEQFVILHRRIHFTKNSKRVEQTSRNLEPDL